MNKMWRKRLALILAAFMVITIAGGCGKKKGANTENQDLSSYPVQSEDTLDYWLPLNALTSGTLNDTVFAKNVEEKTGIKVNYIHPAIGQHDEQFSILIASDALPDIVEYAWYKYPGGYQKAKNDGLIVDLAPYMDTYLSDYNTKISDAKYNPYIKKAMTLENGEIFGVVPLTDLGDMPVKSVYGPIFRQDWLNELNLKAPETIDEWTEVLTAFKEKKNAAKPLVFIYEYIGFYSILSGTYGVKQDFYPNNGKIVYGPMEDGYKQFLTQMNDWYRKGLLDNSFASADESSRDQAFLNGDCGVTYGFLGSNLIKWEDNLKAKFPEAELVPAKHPSLVKGQPCELAPSGNAFGRAEVAVITKECDNPELAAKFLNYGYTDEGSLAYTFGKEGESYIMTDGVPAFTDLIKNNPNYSFGQMLSSYARATSTGPMEVHRQYYKEYYGNPKQVDAIGKWGESNGEKYDMPYLSVSESEADKLSGIQAKLKQYVDEMTMRFIVGSEDLSNFDAYAERLKSFGAEEAISMYQKAYEKAIK